MPQNKNLKPVSLPMELKFGQEPRTEFYNNLSHIKVELIDHPTRSQALNVAWQYVKATLNCPGFHFKKLHILSGIEQVLLQHNVQEIETLGVILQLYLKL